MNLYKVISIHYAPKDNNEGIECFLLANSDEEVYEQIANTLNVEWPTEEKEITEEKEQEDDNVDDEEDYSYDIDGEPATKKQLILHLKGDDSEDVYEFADLYYGQTRYTWQLLKENISDEEVIVLQNCGILS